MSIKFCGNVFISLLTILCYSGRLEQLQCSVLPIKAFTICSLTEKSCHPLLNYPLPATPNSVVRNGIVQEGS